MYKKNAKRILSTILTIILVASVFSGCAQKKDDASTGKESSKQTEKTNDQSKETTNFNETGLPIVNKPMKFVAVSKLIPGYEEDYSNCEHMKRWEKETNVQIEWKSYARDSWDEQKTLLISSGDLPDMFAGGNPLDDNDIMNWSLQKIIIPLKELSKKYAPRFMSVMNDSPDVMTSMLSPDGEFYTFPTHYDIDFGRRDAVLYFNKKWFEETSYAKSIVNEKLFDRVDYSFTTDDFYNLLLEIKQKHPDSIPLTSPKENLFGLYHAFGIEDNSNRIIVKDGKVVFTPTTNEWKEATKYINKLYKAKLLDGEIFTHEWDVYRAKVMQVPFNVGAAYMWTGAIGAPNDDMESEQYNNWVAVPPLVGPDGKQIMYKNPDGVKQRGSMAITTKCKNPEVLVRWQDYLYGEDNSYENSYGEWEKKITKNKEGRIDMLSNASIENTSYGRTINTMFLTTKEMNNKINFNDLIQMTIDVGMTMARPYQTDVAYPQLVFSSEDQNRITEIKTEIFDYVKQMQAKWCIEGGIDKDWEGFKEQLDKLGLKEYLEIYNRNLKRAQQ